MRILLDSCKENRVIRYGEEVIIRDGSRLDGVRGIVYQVKDGKILVLIEREILWPVAETHVERQ